MYSAHKSKAVKMANIVFIRNDLMSKGWFWKSKLKAHPKSKCFHTGLSYLRGAKNWNSVKYNTKNLNINHKAIKLIFFLTNVSYCCKEESGFGLGFLVVDAIKISKFPFSHCRQTSRSRRAIDCLKTH